MNVNATFFAELLAFSIFIFITYRYLWPSFSSILDSRREEISKATGAHFNKPGHSMSDMTISVLEQVSEKDTFYRECRESKHIQDFDLKYNGINRKK